jgi:hypothetical protein
MLAAAASETFHLARLASWRAVSPDGGRDLVAVEAPPGQQLEVAAQRHAAVLQLGEGVGIALHRVRRGLADALRVHQGVAGDLGLAGRHRAAAGVAPQREDGDQDADGEGRQQDAQLARQRQVADQRQAQVVVGAGRSAAAAAARCLRPARLPRRSAASSAEWAGATPGGCGTAQRQRSFPRRRRPASADAELGVGRGQHGGAVVLVLGEKIHREFRCESHCSSSPEPVVIVV